METTEERGYRVLMLLCDCEGNNSCIKKNRTIAGAAVLFLGIRTCLLSLRRKLALFLKECINQMSACRKDFLD
jgi:hypothetical protein